ncbi:hypothetical protein BHM03_00028501 [Ensete ventricosum]|nr:hypothetical protein BHM03_00028501 [Ensete ventricosum]
MGSSDFSWKLADHPKLPKGKTVAVVVLDGWGEANPDQYNCIHVAETPTMDSLKKLLLKGCSENGAKRIRVHILTDGRDVLDGSSVGFVETLENDLAKLREKGIDAQIASGGGRMYVTMDRYEVFLGEAPHKFRSAVEAVKKLREEPKANDQYLPPFVIVDESGKAVGPVVDGDAVVTLNFRADRMVMIAKALEYADFDKFDRVRFPKIRYAGMLQYDGELKLPSHYLVSPPEIDRTSGEYLIILDAIEQVGGIYVVTADHGNAEDMVKRNKTGQPQLDKAGKIQILTSHTLQPVPVAIGGPGLASGVRFRNDVPDGGLANVAATVMNLHGFEAPTDYKPTLVEVVHN